MTEPLKPGDRVRHVRSGVFGVVVELHLPGWVDWRPDDCGRDPNWAERTDPSNLEAAEPLKPSVTRAFEREDRYIVIKRSHMTEGVERDLAMVMEGLAIDPVDAVVIEADWPEYEPVWQMIETRVSGRRPASEGTGDALREAVSFEQAWAQKEAEGYQYGHDALENVRFGWEIAVAALSQPSPDEGAGEPVNDDELTDLISDAISDSIDMDWSGSIGARAVVRALKAEGWTVVSKGATDAE